jgi:hypothetical protein
MATLTADLNLFRARRWQRPLGDLALNQEHPACNPAHCFGAVIDATVVASLQFF